MADTKINDFVKGLGVLSECGLVIYRDVRAAGGTRNEARQVVSAYFLSMSSQEPEEPSKLNDTVQPNSQN